MIKKIINRFYKKYYKIKESFYSKGALINDLNYNISKLEVNNLLFPDYKNKLREHGIDISHSEQSWHYVLFYLIVKKNKYKNFLEIGTFDARFSYNLSKYFNGEIITIDLNSSSDEFENSYSRKRKKDFVLKRNQLLDKGNINFQEMDSFFIIDEFYNKKKFDLIWVDGDHKNPQVTFDIISSIKLLSKKGKLLIDDIIPNSVKMKYTSDESYKTILNLRERGIIKFELYLKRISRSNSYNKKYIAVIERLFKTTID